MSEKVPLPLDKIPHVCPCHTGAHQYEEISRTTERVEYACGCYYVSGYKGGEEWLFGQMVHLA